MTKTRWQRYGSGWIMMVDGADYLIEKRNGFYEVDFRQTRPVDSFRTIAPAGFRLLRDARAWAERRNAP